MFERLIAEPALYVVDHTRVSIRFVAAAKQGTSRIERILAHPMAAAQCQRFLKRVGWQVIEAHDTAGAARLVSERDDLASATLCPAAAATAYGLRVIEANCGDDPAAVTRFFAVQKMPPRVDARHDRALVLSTDPSRLQTLRVHGGSLIELAVGGHAVQLAAGERLLGSYRDSRPE